jgi:hypothetical protein
MTMFQRLKTGPNIIATKEKVYIGALRPLMERPTDCEYGQSILT